MTATIQVNSGMIESAQCPALICKGIWDVTVNYNGNTYEDITLTVENKNTGEESQTTFNDVKVGTAISFGTQNKTTGKYLTVDCEVMKAQ